MNGSVCDIDTAWLQKLQKLNGTQPLSHPVIGLFLLSHCDVSKKKKKKAVRRASD